MLILRIIRITMSKKRPLSAFALAKASGARTTNFQSHRLRLEAGLLLDALAELLDRLHALLAEYSNIDEQTDSHNRWRLFLAGFPLTD